MFYDISSVSSSLWFIYEFLRSLLGLNDVKNPLEEKYHHIPVNVVAFKAGTQACGYDSDYEDP